MNNITKKTVKSDALILTEMLKELIPFIKGDYFLSDGGLLGLTRDRKLISYDNDLDLYLMPETTIEIPNSSNLQLSQYYLDKKVSRKNVNYTKKNKWLEFCSYLRTLPENIGLNRSKIFSLAKDKYPKEAIEAKFSIPYIDIFQLEKVGDDYNIPFWTDYNGFNYKSEEVNKLVFNTDLGFPVLIPYYAENILERQYGKDWKIENPNWKY